MYSPKLLNYKSRRDKFVSNTTVKGPGLSQSVPDLREYANTLLNLFRNM